MSPFSLDEIQRWMLFAVTHPEGPDPASLDETILNSRRQSAGERLAVYQHAYCARLLEVLRELLPCTRFAVGDELFDQLAAGYLQAHPPHSYTLARLADGLAEYLDATRPADWGEFVVELVRLEVAIDRIFDAAGPEDLAPFVVAENSTADLRLLLVPGLELHAFSHPVSTFYTDWKADRQPRWSEAAEQYVALFRRDYVVRRFELTVRQYELLRAISRGLTLGEALLELANRSGARPAGQPANEVRRWFTVWAASGFFVSAAQPLTVTSAPTEH